MTTTFESNQAVQSGYYFNASRWAIEPVAEDGARLPAGPGAWRRVPTLVALLATPVLGLAFLMFLPFIGFALVAQAAVAPVAGLFQGATLGLAAAMSAPVPVGAAHLTGHSSGRASVEERGPPAATALRLLAAPVIGLAYLVALPAIAVVAVAHALVRRLGGHVVDGASDLAATMAPGVATGAAHLSGQDEGGKPAAEATPELEALAREVDEKRKG